MYLVGMRVKASASLEADLTLEHPAQAMAAPGQFMVTSSVTQEEDYPHRLEQMVEKLKECPPLSERMSVRECLLL